MSEGKDFRPFSLDSRDTFKVRQVDRSFVMKGHMGTKEVVMGYEEGCKGYSAIEGTEAARGFHMVFVGSVEALDELFKWSELF